MLAAIALGVTLSIAAFIPASPLQDSQPATAPDTPTAKPAVKPVQREDLPKPEVLFEACREVMGGKERLKGISSMSTEVEMSTPMGPMQMVIDRVHEGGHIAIKQMMGGQVMVITFYDGEVAWAYSPAGDIYRLLDDVAIEQIKSQAGLQDIVGQIESQFIDHATVDDPTFAEKECYKVGMTPKESESNTISYVFFDKKTKLLAGMESLEESPEGKLSVVMTIDEWLEIDGFKFPKIIRVVQTLGGVKNPMDLTFKQIELNKVDPSMFDRPDEVKKQLAEREGEAATQPADS